MDKNGNWRKCALHSQICFFVYVVKNVTLKKNFKSTLKIVQIHFVLKEHCNQGSQQGHEARNISRNCRRSWESCCAKINKLQDKNNSEVEQATAMISLTTNFDNCKDIIGHKVNNGECQQCKHKITLQAWAKVYLPQFALK